jgi:hypothetical protein
MFKYRLSSKMKSHFIENKKYEWYLLVMVISNYRQLHSNRFAQGWSDICIFVCPVLSKT